MKQHISQEQFEHLSDEQQQKVLAWVKDNSITSHLLSVGQMIWLLEDLHTKPNLQKWTLGELVVDIDTYNALELCDVLWHEISSII